VSRFPRTRENAVRLLPDGVTEQEDLSLELKSPGNLDCSRRTHSAIPLAEVANTIAKATDVVIESKTRSLVVDVSSREEVMLVEGVEELESKLEVQLLCQSRIFRQRKVGVFCVGSSEVRDSRTRTCVPERAEIRHWLEGIHIQQRPVRRVETVWILQERLFARYYADQAGLSKLSHHVA
jgi:hypothetical protein